MSEQDRLDELGRIIEAQRAIVHRLYDEWSAACKVLNDFEREQSSIFRKLMDESAAKQLLKDRGYSVSRPHRGSEA